MAPDEFAPPFDRAAALSFDSEHLLRSENIPFDIDNWYPALKPWTFESEFVPLSRPEARAIIRYYRSRYLGRGQLEPHDVSALLALEDRVDAVVRQRFAAAGCFMRLCGRSAKDAEPLDRARVRGAYEAALERLARGEASEPQRLPAALRMRAAASVDALRCRSGSEVMSQLLSSERVYSDMLDWLWYGEPEQIVLRRWEPEISVDLEFRLYVHENRLTAVSQYDHHCRYDHLFPLRDRLLPRMAELWREVHPHVGASSYTMDLTYLPVSDRLRMLELSPFLRCTGAHCFRWEQPEDVDVLEGRCPFEFRLVEAASPHFDEMFCIGWEQRWYGGEDPPAYWEFYQTRAERCAWEWQRCLGRLLCRAALTPFSWLAAATAVASAVVGARTRLGKLFPLAVGMLPVAVGTSLVLGLALPRAGRSSKHCVSLFVYGTLKRGMHWNRKFLSQGAEFVAVATTVDRFPLVVGRCGVPYLLFDQRGHGHRVRGELWRVDADMLEGLDQYEGLHKGYYCRSEVRIEVGGRLAEVQVYAVRASPQALRALPCVPEYRLGLHRERYRGIEHIMLKQRLYLRGMQQYGRRRVFHPSCSIEEDAGVERTRYEPEGHWATGK